MNDSLEGGRTHRQEALGDEHLVGSFGDEVEAPRDQVGLVECQPEVKNAAHRATCQILLHTVDTNNH